MPTFIKTGFWEKLSKAPKEYLNLDNLIQSIGGGGSEIKYYTIKFSQSGLTDPIITPVYNTLNVLPISWLRVGVGSFIGTFPSGTFDINKTVCIISQDYCDTCTFLSAAQTTSQLSISKYENDGSSSDGMELFLTVMIYP